MSKGWHFQLLDEQNWSAGCNLNVGDSSANLRRLQRRYLFGNVEYFFKVEIIYTEYNKIYMKIYCPLRRNR